MRFKSIAGFFLLVLLFTGAGSNAGVNLGASIDDDGLKSFYLAIGDHYKVQEKEVVVVQKRQVRDEEMPVVFYLARQAKVSPEVIVELRLEGRTWMEITTNFGLYADIYHINVTTQAGPPYGKAYGYCKNKPKSEWRKLSFSDSEIVNFVNLRFVSEHYGISPDEVVKLREQGQNYVLINENMKKEKEKGKKDKKKDYAVDNNSKAKGKKNK